jgi:tetratricopeptide (TPR) repeat protein
MATGLIETYYISEKEKYGLYNFHRRRTLETVVGILVESGPTPILLLSGEGGSGRKYFLEAAAWRAGQEGTRTIIISLDLEGFEEGPQGLVRFLDLWSRRRQENAEALRSERLGMARKIAEAIPSSVPGAALLSLLLEWKGPINSLRSVLGESFKDLDGPPRDPRESVRLLLESASRSARLVVHIIKNAQINEVLRRWFLEETRRNPNLLLAFSCHPKDEDKAVAPRAEVLRLEFDPLTPAEFREVLDATFHPNTFPPDLAETLTQYGQGLPSRIASKMKDLVQDEVVLLDRAERWGLSTVGMDAEDFVKKFSAVLLEPVRELLSQLDFTIADRLERFLDLAALCGENVPAILILAHMEVTEDQKEEILNLIDERLVENEEQAILIDHQYGHPSFPRTLLYSFRSPIFARGLVEYIPEGKREKLASELLAFLRRNLAVATRGIAHIFLNLADHLKGREEREEYLRELGWWIGQDEADELSAYVELDIVTKRIMPEMVIDVVESAGEKWLPSHRLALLNATSQHLGEIPFGVLKKFHVLLAVALRDSGHYEEALEEAQLALSISNSSYSPQAASGYRELTLIGDVLYRLGRLKEAHQELTAALEVIRREPGVVNSHLANILSLLSLVLKDLGELHEAQVLSEEAVTISRNVLGERYSHTGTHILELSMILLDLGDLNRAQRTCEEAINIYEEILGKEHHYVALGQSRLASTLQRMGRSAEARILIEQALGEIGRSLGEAHPWAAGSLRCYAEILADLGELKQAQEVGERAIRFLREAWGSDHYRLAKELRALGRIYGLAGEMEKSSRSYSEALAICNKALGEHHPLTAEIRELLENASSATVL